MGKKNKALDPLTNFIKSFRALLNVADKNPEILKPLLEETVGNPVTLGPRVISPADWSKKQVERATAAASEWLERVQKPRKNPIEAAIAADGKRKNKLAEAERLGKWKAAMSKVDDAVMYEVIRKRGSGAFSSGVSDRAVKITKRVSELQPMVAALAASLDAMPQETDAEREAKMLAAKRGMQEIGKKRLGVSS